MKLVVAMVVLIVGSMVAFNYGGQYILTGMDNEMQGKKSSSGSRWEMTEYQKNRQKRQANLYKEQEKKEYTPNKVKRGEVTGNPFAK